MAAMKKRKPGSLFATTALVVVITAILLVFGLIELASSGGVKTHLGTSTFLAGRARDYAPQVDAQGPILFADALGKGRPIYLQHLGPDPKLGWVAIQATIPGRPSTCVLTWKSGAFHDPCSEQS